MTDPIRVLIADDHPVVRTGLCAMLETQPDFMIAGEATTGAEAVALAAETRPDVVLMDLQMPELDGTAAIERIRSADPEASILVLTTYDTDSDIIRAVEAGAIGYLLKDSTREELFAAVRAAANGDSMLSSAVAGRVLDRMRAPTSETLTARELEVLAAVARGMSNRDIAAHLHLSQATVKTHLLHVFAKLGVDDRTAAVTRALETGVIRLGRR